MGRLKQTLNLLLFLFASFAFAQCPEGMNEYPAFVRSIYDADTARLDVGVGLGVWLSNQPIRLLGIDAPEVTGDTRPAGLAARDRLRELVLGKDVLLCTDRDRKEKYGRYLGIIMTLDGTDLNELLVEENFAVYREY